MLHRAETSTGWRYRVFLNIMTQLLSRLDYGPDDREMGIRFPAGAKVSYLLHDFQSGSGAHPISYTMCIAGWFRGGLKRPRREFDHSPPSSAEVNNGGAIPPLPHTSSAWCLIHPMDDFIIGTYFVQIGLHLKLVPVGCTQLCQVLLL
jgi:hypothetical protein